jgi:hypothetical protein
MPGTVNVIGQKRVDAGNVGTSLLLYEQKFERDGIAGMSVDAAFEVLAAGE